MKFSKQVWRRNIQTELERSRQQNGQKEDPQTNPAVRNLWHKFYSASGEKINQVRNHGCGDHTSGVYAVVYTVA